MLKLSSHDALLYVAGFVDGEGSIMLHCINDRIFLRLEIGNTCKDALLFIRDTLDAFGISTRVQPMSSSQKNRKKAWRLRCTNREDVREICILLLPYLIVKHKQADLAIQFVSFCSSKYSESDMHWEEKYILYMQMKSLNA